MDLVEAPCPWVAFVACPWARNEDPPWRMGAVDGIPYPMEVALHVNGVLHLQGVDGSSVDLWSGGDGRDEQGARTLESPRRIPGLMSCNWPPRVVGLMLT